LKQSTPETIERCHLWIGHRNDLFSSKQVGFMEAMPTPPKEVSRPTPLSDDRAKYFCRTRTVFSNAKAVEDSSTVWPASLRSFSGQSPFSQVPIPSARCGVQRGALVRFVIGHRRRQIRPSISRYSSTDSAASSVTASTN
jgi:hypothetical protein